MTVMDTLLWVVSPLTAFLALPLYFAFMRLRTKDLKFRSQMPSPAPALGRRALLVNVVVPAGEPPSHRPRT